MKTLIPVGNLAADVHMDRRVDLSFPHRVPKVREPQAPIPRVLTGARSVFRMTITSSEYREAPDQHDKRELIHSKTFF